MPNYHMMTEGVGPVKNYAKLAKSKSQLTEDDPMTGEPKQCSSLESPFNNSSDSSALAINQLPAEMLAMIISRLRSDSWLSFERVSRQWQATIKQLLTDIRVMAFKRPPGGCPHFDGPTSNNVLMLAEERFVSQKKYLSMERDDLYLRIIDKCQQVRCLEFDMIVVRAGFLKTIASKCEHLECLHLAGVNNADKQWPYFARMISKRLVHLAINLTEYFGPTLTVPMMQGIFKNADKLEVVKLVIDKQWEEANRTEYFEFIKPEVRIHLEFIDYFDTLNWIDEFARRKNIEKLVTIPKTLQIFDSDPEFEEFEAVPVTFTSLTIEGFSNYFPSSFGVCLPSVKTLTLDGLDLEETQLMAYVELEHLEELTLKLKRGSDKFRDEDRAAIRTLLLKNKRIKRFRLNDCWWYLNQLVVSRPEPVAGPSNRPGPSNFQNDPGAGPSKQLEEENVFVQFNNLEVFELIGKFIYKSSVDEEIRSLFLIIHSLVMLPFLKKVVIDLEFNCVPNSRSLRSLINELAHLSQQQKNTVILVEFTFDVADTKSELNQELVDCCKRIVDLEKFNRRAKVIVRCNS